MFGSVDEPRTLEKTEMKQLMKDWKEEYEGMETQRNKIAQDYADDQGRKRGDQKRHTARHGRFGLHLRRTYGNAAFCRCIIQTGRFDEKLLISILQAVKEEKEEEDEDKEESEKQKWAKVRACNEFRRGKHVAKTVDANWYAWYNLDPYEIALYWQYKDGSLMQKRNEAAMAFGHGLVHDEREEVIAQLGFEKCFTNRVMEHDSGITLRVPG